MPLLLLARSKTKPSNKKFEVRKPSDHRRCLSLHVCMEFVTIRPLILGGTSSSRPTIFPPNPINGTRQARPSDCALLYECSMESDGRKRPVHLPVNERHNTPVILYVTVCTKNRKRI